MKRRPPLPEGPFLVVGLARSGRAAARLLAERGGEVRGCDAGRPEGTEALAEAGVTVSLESDGIELLDGVRTVVKSPGVPQESAAVAEARRRGIPILGELEIGWRALDNRVIAVTGTNGKTTVTELIGHIHRTAGEPVAVAGNVGAPLASLAGAVAADATVVCECSSFQLEDAEAFAPECAVFLNLAPDHLDRHPSAEQYLAAKLRIFANQSDGDVAVFNGDEPALAGRDIGGCARRLAFCSERGGDPDCELTLASGTIFWRSEPLLEVAELPLLGVHNAANAMAAAAAALAMGLAPEPVADALCGFGGLPHRLERIAERDGVLYVNDSKATNVAAAAAGLRAFDGGVHAILGGSLKGEPFDGLRAPVGERCAACYLIGEAAEPIADALAPLAERGMRIERCSELEEAVRAAAGAAQPGEVVLLSPACASFDAFRDFEHRGERFRELVGKL